MTDVMPEQPATDTEDWSDVEQSADTAYPEFPANPHNHRFTISMDGRGPMLVFRANTAAELQAAAEELEDPAAGAAIGRAWAAFKAGAALGNGLGAAPMAPGAPAPVQPVQPVPLPQSPQAQYPVGPPAVPQGPAPAQWQNAGAPQAPQAPQGPSPEYRNAGWYRLDVPFPKKAQFDALVAQYGMQKGRPSEGGSYSFNSKGEKAWYVSPQFAGAFQQFSPVPA
jgi:hypothetical protein